MAQRRKILKTFGIRKVLAGKVVFAWVLKDQSTFHGGLGKSYIAVMNLQAEQRKQNIRSMGASHKLGFPKKRLR